jgi:Na+/proline symporter
MILRKLHGSIPFVLMIALVLAAVLVEVVLLYAPTSFAALIAVIAILLGALFWRQRHPTFRNY